MSKETLNKYNKTLILLSMSTEEEEEDKLKEQRDSLWAELTDAEREEGNEFYNEYCTLITSEASKIKKENEEYKVSFDLYFNGTRALHKTYPHPDELTWRDLGQMCMMASEEIRLTRKAIGDALENLCKVASIDDGVSSSINILKGVCGDGMIKKLEFFAWKQGRYWYLFLEKDNPSAWVYETSVYHNDSAWSGTVKGHENISFMFPTRLEAGN